MMNDEAASWLSCTPLPQYSVTDDDEASDISINGGRPSLYTVTVAGPESFSPFLPSNFIDLIVPLPVKSSLMAPRIFLKLNDMSDPGPVMAAIGKLPFPKLLYAWL